MLRTLRPYLRPATLPNLTPTSSLILTSTLTRSFSTKRTTSMFTSSPPPPGSNPATWPTRPYTPRHPTWPYTPADFARQDPSPDPAFYTHPRFVTHIDDAAIATLRAYYDAVLPRAPGTRLLDFCSSWVSHYPRGVEAAAATGDVRVVGVGMNAAEMAANPVLNAGRVVRDLNAEPDIAGALVEAGAVEMGTEVEGGWLDASTNVVSTDYLTRPREVLASLRTATKEGGAVHLVVSNRCFPTKAVRRWLEVGEAERVQMVGDFLHFAGWEGIEIVELSDGTVGEEEKGRMQREGGLQGLMSWVGMGSRDPLWVVRGVKR